MAMAVRTLDAWSVQISSAMASWSVRCAVEPARQASQQVVPRRVNSAGLTASSSGNGAQLRCQATLTAVRELAAADGVLEREVEMRCIEESRAVLRSSFEVASVIGRAECVGTEECRPVLDEARFLSVAGVEATVDTGAEAYEQSRMYHGRRGGGDAYSGMATLKPADSSEEGVHMGRGEMVGALEAALQGAGRNAEMLCQLAMRAWRKLGDADRAEQLYMEALQLAPEDSAIQARYAQFLWQCDA